MAQQMPSKPEEAIKLPDIDLKKISDCQVGIAHTRLATQDPPSRVNCHPHRASMSRARPLSEDPQPVEHCNVGCKTVGNYSAGYESEDQATHAHVCVKPLLSTHLTSPPIIPEDPGNFPGVASTPISSGSALNLGPDVYEELLVVNPDIKPREANLPVSNRSALNGAFDFCGDILVGTMEEPMEAAKSQQLDENERLEEEPTRHQETITDRHPKECTQDSIVTVRPLSFGVADMHDMHNMFAKFDKIALERSLKIEKVVGPTTFHGYSKLPGELRAMIIAKAINCRRLLRDYERWESPEPLPAFLYVNKETREETLKHIRLVGPIERQFEWSYINPLHDVAWFHPKQPTPREVDMPGLRAVAVNLCRQWRHDILDVDGRAAREQEKQVEELSEIIRDLPDVEEVFLVRTLPGWIQDFLKSPECTIKLSKHACGYFYQVHDQVELWHEVSHIHAPRLLPCNRYAYPPPIVRSDHVSRLVNRLIEEYDEREREHHLDSCQPIEEIPDTNFEPQRQSKEIVEAFEGAMNQLFERCETIRRSPLKFTVVYGDPRLSNWYNKYWDLAF